MLVLLGLYYIVQYKLRSVSAEFQKNRKNASSGRNRLVKVESLMIDQTAPVAYTRKTDSLQTVVATCLPPYVQDTTEHASTTSTVARPLPTNSLIHIGVQSAALPLSDETFQWRH